MNVLKMSKRGLVFLLEEYFWEAFETTFTSVIRTFLRRLRDIHNVQGRLWGVLKTFYVYWDNKLLLLIIRYTFVKFIIKKMDQRIHFQLFISKCLPVFNIN